MSTHKPPAPPAGPIEAGKWPERLRAHAVSPGDPPRLFGYDVPSDLAANYRMSEITFLSLTGELPATDTCAQVFERVLLHLSAVSVAEAPAHVAHLANRAATARSSVIALGALSLGEQVRFELRRTRPLLSWVAETTSPFPEGFTAVGTGLVAGDRLKAQIASLGFESRVWDRPLSLIDRAFCVLVELGVTKPEQIAGAWVWSRLPTVMAEAFSVTRGSLGDYPINLPSFEYQTESAKTESQ